MGVNLSNCLISAQSVDAEAYSLSRVPLLVKDLKPYFNSFALHQLTFLSSLREGESLLKWLMKHKSNDEFNNASESLSPK